MQTFSSVTKINVEDMAIRATSFPAMLYPNKYMEIQCRKMFLKGISVFQNELLIMLKDYFNSVTPCTTDIDSEIRIEDKSLWDFYNALLFHSTNKNKVK